MDNEKRRLISKHISRSLSRMTDDQLQSLARHIEEGDYWQGDPNTPGSDIVWDLIAGAEERARLDRIKDLTKSLVELAEFKAHMQRASARVHKPEEKGIFALAEVG
jgi:hypothetical protein